MNSHQPPDYICPFCLLVEGEETEYNSLQDIVFQNDRVLAIISPMWWVNNPGHVLVIPKKHYENIYNIPERLLAQVQTIGKRIALAMKDSYGCDGISFRQHNEPAGEQDVWHFHLHVSPRWNGDNLYLNHEKTRWVSSEEKQTYVEKLKRHL